MFRKFLGEAEAQRTMTALQRLWPHVRFFVRQTQSGPANKISGQRSWYIEFLNPNDPRTEHQRLTDIDYHAAMKRIPSDERTEIWKTINQ